MPCVPCTFTNIENVLTQVQDLAFVADGVLVGKELLLELASWCMTENSVGCASCKCIGLEQSKEFATFLSGQADGHFAAEEIMTSV